MSDMSDPQASYNYCVTAHRPTSVTHAIAASFTSGTARNLVIARSTRLEINLLTPEGLQPMADVPIYGRICVLEAFRPPGEDKDLLFIMTERYKMCFLEYDSANGEILTRASGDVQDRIGRPTENGQLGIVDPGCRMLGLHLYEQMLKIIPVGQRGTVKEAFNVRLEELQVLDLKFLSATRPGAPPSLAVLYQDQKEARHLKTYDVNEKDKTLNDGSWGAQNLDGGASLLIPVPAPYGGAVVVGESSVAYVNANVQRASVSSVTMVRSFGKVDSDGSRYLLSDIKGTLWLLALITDAASSSIMGLKLEALGTTSVASALAYLDNGVVYVGSSSGDSQLVRLHENKDSQGSFVEVLETITGLGPIVNFCVVDLDRQGQGQIVTCSGVYQDGSLRVVRNGVGINEQAAVELPGVKGLWALKTDAASAHDAFLVVSFISETRILAMNIEDELDETEIPGFDCDSHTLLCSSVAHGQLLQVTPTHVRLVSAGSLQLLSSWQAPAGTSVTLAAANDLQVLVALGGGCVVYLVVGQGSLTEVRTEQMGHEVSCMDIYRGSDAGGNASSIAVVGLWNTVLRLFSVPSLTLILEEKLAAEAIPRSVLLAQLEGVSYLLAGLGDGQLFSFVFDSATAQLSERRKISLGTQPVTLRTITSKGSTHVFACSDRPTVIYSASRKLLYSNVNLREATHICSFNCASFPDSLAVASDNKLTIGTIDDIQKLHIRTVPLGEQPRRIAHQTASKTFAVSCSRIVPGENGEDVETSTLRLLDDITFETVDTFKLEPFEQGTSLCSLQFADDAQSYYAYGTAFLQAEELEPTKGRILIFHVENGKLVLVAEKEAKGCVYNINAFNGKLLAGVNAKVMLFKWVHREDDTRELVNECGHHGHICAVYVAVRGDFIAVGDLMKSISVLLYKQEEGEIEELARDINATWMTAIEVLDDDTFLGAENNFNLFVCRKNADAANDEERARLEVVGEYHLGHFVNCFRHGSLVMRSADNELAHIQTVLFVTIDGVIGVLASLPQAHFAFLLKVQEEMCKVVKGVGGFSWEEWRSFSNDRRTVPSRNFIDGDLVESFLDLQPPQMADVASRVGVPVEELIKRIEQINRVTH